MPPMNSPAVGSTIPQSLLKPEVVLVDSLVPDPNNARLHPERNLMAIRESLRRYGQKIPIVVRRCNRVVIKGNGTLESAKLEGWKHIAVTWDDSSDIDAAGYGLADNKTAELAQWDYEVVKRLEALQAQVGMGIVGWTDEELKRIRLGEEIPVAPVQREDNKVLMECPECGAIFPTKKPDG